MTKWLLISLLLTGCATCEPIVRVVEPVEPPVLTSPEKPFISPNSPPAEKARALADYILQLQATLNKALTALDAYRKKED